MTSLVYESSAAFELKGEMAMLSVLRLLDVKIDRITDELSNKVRQAPDFFRNMPIIIDLQAVSEQNESPAFAALVEILREPGQEPGGD